MRTQLVLDAFRQALHTRHRGHTANGARWTSAGLVHHSDAGCLLSTLQACLAKPSPTRRRI